MGQLVVGLGNPGPRYAKTRHNFGFLVADALFTAAKETNWQNKFGGEICDVRFEDARLILLKPMTYMNLSGQSVVRAARFYRFEPASIIVPAFRRNIEARSHM